MATFIKNNEDRIGSRGDPIQSNISDNESSKMQSSHGYIQGYNGVATVDAKHQVIVEAKAFGSGSEHKLLKTMVEGSKLNLGLKDLTSTQILADTGFHSKDSLEYLDEKNLDGYVPDNHFRDRDPNLQGRDIYKRPKDSTRTTTNDNKGYFDIKDFKFAPNKDHLVCPAGLILMRVGKEVVIKGNLYYRYKGKKSQCSSCCLLSKCIRGEKTKLKQIFIFKGKNKKRSLIQEMKDKIDTYKGRFIYSQRMGIVEPVFGNIRWNMKLDYFTVKTKQKVDIQWKLFTTLHNLKKIFRYGSLHA